MDHILLSSQLSWHFHDLYRVTQPKHLVTKLLSTNETWYIIFSRHIRYEDMKWVTKIRREMEMYIQSFMCRNQLYPENLGVRSFSALQPSTDLPEHIWCLCVCVHHIHIVFWNSDITYNIHGMRNNLFLFIFNLYITFILWFEPKRASPHKAGGKINGWNRGCKANTVNQESGFSFIWCGWLVGGFHTYDCASFGICMNTRGSAHNIISLSLYPTSKPLLIPSPFCVLFFLIWPGSTLSLLLDYALRLRVVREREGRWTNRWCTFCMRAFVCVGGPMWWVWASHCHVSVVVCTWSAWMNTSESKMGSLVVPFYVLYSNVLLLAYLSYQSLVLINLFFPWNNVSIHWSQLIMSCYMSF